MNNTPEEAAKKIRMSTSWVRQQITAKKINVIRIGGKIFISQDEIDKINTKGVEK
ncbi:MAG: helix-turn-helix domain-containing protein [Desulfosarcina sp.]|nr:helix-turn-helix domain-containing protein [Desulfobacterales bacterium]